MPFDTISDGLTLVIPTNGTTSWGTVVRNSTWKKISSHDHSGGGNGTKITNAGIADDSIDKAKLSKNLAVTQQATKTPTGTTETINWDDGNKATLDLSSATGDLTLTLNNPIEGADYRIKIIQGGTKRTITWPAAVIWPGGEEATQHHDANTTNIVWLDYDGTNYLAKWETKYS